MKKLLPDLFYTVYNYRYLTLQMIKREIANRYRGSVFSFAWSVINPLLMLAVYTFVFSVVFQARWQTGENESRIDFAITLFAGLIIFNLFAEVVNKSPSLILTNVNLVKKVVFPLEILPLVSIGAVGFQSLVSLMVLLTTMIIFKSYVPWTIVYLPLILIPLLLLSLGISWFLAAITVYVRDVAHVTSIFTTILLFTSAIFYPISRLPENYQTIIMLNPLAILIQEGRQVLIFGQPPDWGLLGIMLMVGLFIATGGYVWFKKARKGFADVL
ncbi:MAG TPA: ABC transporter permease [Niabella sp.]|nr:ABC transporter permease [Niabella sp.]